MSEKFYKIAHPSGWDFYSFDGRQGTINYRDNIGKVIKCPTKGKAKLCSATAIHASRNPNQCFIGGKIPCSLYLVEGKPVLEDANKCGFRQLKVLEELNPAKIFKWRYEEACNPVHPFKIKPPKIKEKQLRLLKQWGSIEASVRASVMASVRGSIEASVMASVWAYVGASVRGSVWAYVGASGRGSIEAYVRGSVLASVWAYVGSMFSPCISEWKYTEHKKGEYPFQPAIDLWKMGLVPCFDGEIWRLHGGEGAKVLWEGGVG